MVNDEIIVAAILKCGTATGAAAELGISPSTVYRRFRSPSFMEIYKSAKADVLRMTVEEIQDIRSTAIDTINDIMCDESVNPAIRLQAAQTVLSNDIRYISQLTVAENDIHKMSGEITSFEYALNALYSQDDEEQ